MADPIFVDNVVRIDLIVRDENDELVDPVTLAIVTRSSSGTSTNYVYPGDPEITRTAAGTYYAEFPVDKIGVWEYDWVTTSPVVVDGGEIYVIARPTESAPGVTSISDYTRFYLGGENWNVLATSENFGIAYVTLGIEIIKRRILTSPPPPDGESLLNPHVLAYLGILSALELLPACRDAWASRLISRSTGNDPAEITTYTDRAKMIGELQDDLLRRLAEVKAAAIPYLDDEVETAVAGVIAIDEAEDMWRVTEDPRVFPPANMFPWRPDEVAGWR